jgi:hypothetical protein
VGGFGGNGGDAFATGTETHTDPGTAGTGSFPGVSGAVRDWE